MISVIVPVYKVEKYLRRCVDSILAQTYTNFELLFIDDGSPDNSGKICDEYAARDPRVRVFHKPNGGVSSARNLGLDNARGEWIVFVDSDDWVTEDYLADLMRDPNADLRLNGFECIGREGECIREFPDACCTEPKDVVDSLLKFGAINFRNPYCKRFNKDLIKTHSIRFDEFIKCGEDTVFVYEYLQYADSISLSSAVCYKYNMEVEGSLSKRLEIRTPVPYMEKISSSIRKIEGNLSLSLRQLEFNLLAYVFTGDIIDISQSTLPFSQKVKRIKEIINTDFGRTILKINDRAYKTGKCRLLIDCPALLGLSSLAALVIALNRGYPIDL